MDSHYEIRWFTPKTEVELCGHATLASAYILFHHRQHPAEKIVFSSRQSGLLSVERQNGHLVLDFPADEIAPCPIPQQCRDAFIPIPQACFKGRSDYMLVFKNQKDIELIWPNIELLSQVDARGIIVTAPGDKVDFVSRFFAPQAGITEDPVTGSAHTTLTVYWANRLKKNELTAEQLSTRKGYLKCFLENGRVKIAGKAKLYMSGEIYLDTN
jgi:PhzF family phenazine biosynthesis protein